MENLAENLLKLTYNDVHNKKLSFEGITTIAKVVKVYDGDTITLVWKYLGDFVKYSCRLAGFNAPEIKKNRTMKGTEEEIKEELKRGKIVKDYLCNYLNNCKYKNLVKVKFYKMDLYGRPLCVIYLCNDLNCQELLFDNSINKHLMDKFELKEYNPSKLKLN